MVAPPKKKLSKGAIAGIVGGSIVVVLLLVFFVVLPRIVAGRVRDEADKRALSIDFSTPTLSFSQVTLRSVVVRPKSSEAVKIEAPTMDADLSGFSPSFIHLPGALATIVGSPSDVSRATDEVRAADGKIPPENKLPIDVVGGKLQWKDLLGSGSALSFDTLSLVHDPRPGAATSLDVKVSNGTLSVSPVTIAPIKAHLSQRKKKIHLTSSLQNDAATIDFSRDVDGDVLDVAFDHLQPKDVEGKIAGLDLSKASIDGAMSYARDADGAASSKGEITASKIHLPPISIGPLSVALGTSLRVKWKATPKKGKPGVMKIESGALDIAILGVTRTVVFGGELEVGEEGTGPFKGNVTWSTETFQCSDLVKGVSGTIGASGTLGFDLADLGAARLRPKIDMNCDITAGIGNFLQQIP